jgi:formaldehyde-activating enzyme involved in methanogenesis
MAKNYKIKVKVEIVESDQAVEEDLIETEAGQFEMVISEEQAISIDACEQALLQTNYPAIRAAIAKHLTELSKKKRLSQLDPERSDTPNHTE